ncbi:acetyl-CoA carboxylase [Companilactobacillus huachuanensis]|uniref:Acetyl-CoA carboxylase n=1 Tax=Companilactobacillus huachuanensis TaxID=2559914 RepID=A0ABW1RMU1_9LACO|nr:acetyl-CoA carboxylase [Companilactobacillus huachuanensis]
MNKDLRIILERISQSFTRRRDTQYYLQVVNDCYDCTYNFFINIRPRGERLHSIPLHTVEDYRLSYLEKIIDRIMEKYQLSITYDGFVGQKWPVKQELIQKRRHKDE